MEELLKIQSLLKIPVGRIVTFPQYLEIYSSNQNVGSLPYVTVANINTYDTSDAILNNFRWSFIYKENVNHINPLILNLVNQPVEITIGSYRNLYIRDVPGNLLFGVTCSFSNEGWTIERI